MKLITTVVRPERLPEVKAALFRAGITGITLSRLSGHGGEHEIVSQYRGTTLVMEFHEKASSGTSGTNASRRVAFAPHNCSAD